MSQPFSRIPIPEPEIPRPFKRRLQPNSIQQMARSAWQETRRHGERLRLKGQDLWRRVRRRPKALGLVAGAIALSLLGAYTLSASGAGRSMCASAQQAKSKTGGFVLLMDRVTGPVAGPELEIHYDVCGLSSGAAYRGRVQITQQRPAKKSSAKPKPVVISFRDKVDGPATRRHRELELPRLKPGTYTLELSITDSKGRERKTLQKLQLGSR